MLPEIELYEHQKRSIEFYQTHDYCLNGSEAGTGKTIPAMAILETCTKGLVVCPAFLTRNWKSEFKKFTGLDVAIYPEKGRITVVSVDQIYKDAALFHNTDVVVVDECHLVCSLKTRRTMALHSYVKANKPKKLILMSGTPMRNRIPELYSLLMLVDYGAGKGFQRRFPTQFGFNAHFSFPVEKRFGGRRFTQFEGSRNLQDLKPWLNGTYFKYKLEDLKDVPDVVYEDVEAVTGVDLLMLATDEELAVGWEQMELTDTPPKHISSAKLESAKAKVPFTIEYCDNLMQSGQGPIVVFSDHIQPAKDIALGLSEHNSAVITGETPMGQRDSLVRSFQAGNIKVLVGTIGAMGTGLTLTAASLAVRNDLSWVPAMNAQATGRIRRIGQKSKCRVVDIVREGIDAKIAKKLKQKEQIIAATL